MSLRKFMHERNQYKVEPNFKKLGEVYPDFRKHLVTDLSGKLKFNFKNPESLRVLTEVLLKHDFNLTVKIPSTKLVPALPLRLNYILWLEDLITHCKLQNIHGLDIGTGAIAIYPLLCSTKNSWRMTGSEIDTLSTNSALETIKTNKLEELIQIFPSNKSTIFKEIIETGKTFDFSMCNPPFYDVDKMDDRRSKKMAPRNAPTGSDAELSIEGGEKQFVLKMIDESLELKHKIKIYTTMVGHKSSLGFFKKKFREKEINNFTWTEFCQGHTKRWGLAWSFIEEIDLKSAPFIRTRTEVAKKSDGFAVELEFPAENGVPEVVGKLKTWMAELRVEIEELDLEEEDLDVSTWQIRAFEDSWSHARRKRRMMMRNEGSDGSDGKKRKLEDGSEVLEQAELPVERKELFLECTMAVGEIGAENDGNCRVRISMILQGGSGGKNALETFRQFLINKLGIREYFQGQGKGKSPKKKKKKKSDGKSENQ